MDMDKTTWVFIVAVLLIGLMLMNMDKLLWMVLP
jgi:regulatory protein YycI of two-component signal transduction system YycFG